MNNRNKYVILAAIVFAISFATKVLEAFSDVELSLERYVLVGIIFPLLVMMHFIHHLRNPDFYEDKKEYKFLSLMYKYVFIPGCFLYIFAGYLFS